MEQTDRRRWRRQLIGLLILPVSFAYLELTAKLFVFGFSSFGDVMLSLLTAFAAGAAISALLTLTGQKACLICTLVVLGLQGVIFSLHVIYYDFFHSIFVWGTLGMAGGLTEFWRETLGAIFRNFHALLLAFLPFILLLIFRKQNLFLRRKARRVQKTALILAAATVLPSFLLTIAVPVNRTLFFSAKTEIVSVYSRYGVIGGACSEAASALFSPKEEIDDNPFTVTDQTVDATDTNTDVTDVPTPIVYGENALPIDFDALIASESNSDIRDMHSYFAGVPASKKNEYTGYFEGKNLIFLSLEGFTYKAIDPQLTPTLYKMYTEGFVFRNFYDSMWGGSTASGEYSNMTGNFYTTATCLKLSANTLTYSALGNQFRSGGYDTYAYHNHTYTYYGRDKSHPNFGYDLYHGVGNGLELPHRYWPNSDLELAQATTADFLSSGSDKPFHVYYMTVSGHANYTWVDNRMCSLHRKDIPEDFPHSENVKAYYACQLEVELMLNELIARLEEAGQLENTVFAMCCDHYPYALSDAELAELYGLPESGIRSNFELYRNAFILWSASMEEPVIVDTPCSSYDIAPTLYNLFGLSFDSRLITGTDILSSTENIVILNTLSSAGSWNWITEKGVYHTTSRTFVPADGVTMSAEEQSAYVSLTNRKVAAMRKYSLAILDKDYYRAVFNNDLTLKAVKAAS